MMLQYRLSKYFSAAIIWLTAMLLSMCLFSCKKDYEKVPVEQLTINYVFNPTDSNGRNAREFLNSIYAVIPQGLNRVSSDILDAATDDAISSATGTPDVLKLATGGYTASSFPSPENVWANCYNGIRRSTIFVNNVNVVPFKEKLANGVSIRNALKGEARFLRAYFYFELLKRYGAVPLLGDKVYDLEDDVQFARNSFSECVEYIVSECDAIKDSLQTNPVADPLNYSHVATKGAALALKARTLLYAASPLYNNAANQNPVLGYVGYNVARWQRAADAAKDIIDLNVFALTPNFKDAFFSQTNSEVIFFREVGIGKSVEEKNGPVGFPTALGNGRTSPTQELVDAFTMSNGLPISDPASGYDEGNPYSNRDPRFAMSILYNGSQWLSTSLQTFIGGVSRPGGTQQQTKTGYYMRKFMGNYENVTSYGTVNQDFLIFRYAEVLLNYAEALNEASGPSLAAMQPIIDLRKRAGISAGADNLYGLSSAFTQEQLRQVIRTERRVELAFEEHRYFDVRRWKIAETVLNRTLNGMNIQKYSSGRLEYQVAPVLAITFNDPKRYFYPIPYDEVVKNPNMQQNPGWGL